MARKNTIWEKKRLRALQKRSMPEKENIDNLYHRNRERFRTLVQRPDERPGSIGTTYRVYGLLNDCGSLTTATVVIGVPAEREKRARMQKRVCVATPIRTGSRDVRKAGI